ncbi:helix-turn-helix transcriptional regulator [Demequina soli]|uniref:helix-turn-helix transcriptional regulator n=1 Tax=Demequina soli TaxID=1638987 RepID=UPI0007827088|nr:LuxR family transcriptional regulator [Demequina soli]
MGREDELESLHALLAGTRNADASALVIHGDPGIGKTTLLESALARSTGLRVLHAPGFAVESALPYSGLQRLGRPLAHLIDGLAAGQARALLIAAGLADGPAPERALVGLGMLSLLALAGDEEPTVCVIDDAHRLDRESLEVLGFVARRLSAERVGMVFAARPEESTMRALAGIREIPLAGLDPDAAAALLRAGVDAEIDPGVIAGIVATTGGNPLALTDLGTRWSAEELTAAALAHAPMPVGERLEGHYSRAAGLLPEPTRRWLVVAAAESTGDASAIRGAAATLDLPPDASAPAEHERLVEVRESVRFRHPLVRSAVYASATDADRRAAHAALRAEAVARGRPEVAAWHAAAASGGPDEAVAAELEHVADLAGARGGLESRAHLLARAADLSTSAPGRSRRLVRAAEAAVGGGAATLARQLLAQVDPNALAPRDRGTMRMAEAACIAYLTDVPRMHTVVATFVAAADHFRPVEPALEQAALLQALNSALSTEHGAAGWPLRTLAGRLNEAAVALPGPVASALEAAASLALDDYETAAPLMRAMLARLDAMADDEIAAFAFYAVVPSVGLCDFEAAAILLRRIARACRARGDLRSVDGLYWVLSALELSRNNPRLAADYMGRSVELRRSLGYGDELTVNAALAIWQGLPDDEAAALEDGMRAASFGGVARMAAGARAIREIARGDYARATVRLAALVDDPYLQASHHHVPELVEAAVRSGDQDRARAAAAWLARVARAAPGDWTRAMALRAEALLADDAHAEASYLSSIALLSADGYRGERARGRLLYGEWLRRVRRRADARAQLTQALADLVAVGATAFAERARRELAALGAPSGGDIPPPDAGPLSAQEARIARMAAGGATNADIGAALFISANTVDYHLRKVFRKLGVTSRRQLGEHLPRA